MNFFKKKCNYFWFLHYRVERTGDLYTALKYQHNSNKCPLQAFCCDTLIFLEFHFKHIPIITEIHYEKAR